MAFPFPMNVIQMAMMFEFLANLQENEQDEFAEHIMEDSEELKEEESSTQEEMIQRFKKMRAQFAGPGGIFGDPMIAGMLNPGSVATSLTFDDAKHKSDIKSLVELKPMLVNDLSLHTTHNGKYLCGWIAVDDAFFGISSSSLLLQDVTGRLVEIAAYDLVDTNLPPIQRQRVLARRFPKDKPIVVIEPYFKVRMDSTVGIRVDDAQELIPWREVPTDLNSWKKLGNQYFTELTARNKGCGALACYHRALETIEPEVHTIAVLLSNLATCRFKVGDFVTSIQLSGTAVHLNPSYFKAWFRLASALAENEANLQNEGKVSHSSVVTRVVAHARSVLPNLTSQEQQMLEDTLKRSDTFITPDNLSQFHSYSEWCVVMDSLSFVLTEDDFDEEQSADAWRKDGSSHFSNGDLKIAENCYRKGLAASMASCRDISQVLNNVAAVHLTLYRERSSGISEHISDKIPTTEAALLNCTVAGVLDPLNHKAWARRTRCLKYLGFTDDECTTDLQIIRSSVLSKTSLSIQNTAQVQEFQTQITAEIQRGLQRSSGSKIPRQIPNVYPGQPDTHRPSATTEPNDSEGVSHALPTRNHADIDAYIARMEGFVARMRSVFRVAKSRSNPRLQQLPREILMFLENPPPKIHMDFPKQHVWPAGVDSNFARKVLYRVYLDACVNPWIPAHTMRTGKYFEDIDISDQVKRWHGIGAMEILSARRRVKYGEIVDGREVESGYTPSYQPRTRSSFANQFNRAEVYYLGETHVAIGFNDFSSLLAATLHDNRHNGQPLKFVGFEMSEFAVAKCKVVAVMLESADIPISNVMEVWLSSVWSETTLKNFRKSVNVVLESLHEQPVNPKVIKYLRHWASSEAISASKAHSEFFANSERSSQYTLQGLYSFRRKIDQLELMQYMLTGEIRVSSDVINLVEKEQGQTGNTGVCSTSSVASGSKKKRNRKKKQKAKKGSSTAATFASGVGSLTMWSVPDGSPPLDSGIAFNTVDFMKLLEDYEDRERKQKNSTEKLSVVDLFVIHILKNLHRLRGLMLAKKLTIELHHGVVKAVRDDSENQELLTRIAMLRPGTISWSNMVDYFLPEDFHDLARRCAMFGNCVHYGYSMNWTTQVCGASIIDYDPKTNQQTIDFIVDLALGLPSESPLPSMFKMTGLDKLLVLPLRENPLNSTGYVLARMFNEEWIDHFKMKGQMTRKVLQRLGTSRTSSNCDLQIGAMDLAIPNPLDRSSLTLHMSWCYDPDINLVNNCQTCQPSAEVKAEILAWHMQHLRA